MSFDISLYQEILYKFHNLNSEVFAALVGALIGGFISILLQISKIVYDNYKASKNESLDNLKISKLLIIKLLKILTNLNGYRKHIEESFSNHQGNNKPSSFLIPVINTPQYIFFSDEELIFLMKLKNDNLFNKIIRLDSLHNSNIDCIKKYNEKREFLMSIFPSHEVDGLKVTAFLNQEDNKKLSPLINELDNLAIDLRKFFNEDTIKVQNILYELDECVVKVFKFKPTIKKESHP
jgi:hypothetical protein